MPEEGTDPGQNDPEGQQQEPLQQQQQQWTPPSSQEELDRLINKATAKVHGRYKDYDQLKDKAGEYDVLLATTQTDQERAAAKARAEGRDEAMGTLVPELVRAKFEAKAAGRLTPDQLDVLLEDADLTKFVDAKGKPDADKIQRKIDALAPKTPPPSFGQGNRGTPAQGVRMDDWIRSKAGYTA